MTTPHATVAILSIGQMGVGIASLLHAHNFRITTNISDRSAATHARAEAASIELLATDRELVDQADYVLSIVPPRDARKTAERVIDVLKAGGVREGKKEALWYLDLNAGSPDTVTELDGLFRAVGEGVRFVDGGIIGAPPAVRADGTWARPGIPLSGPRDLRSAPVAGALLADVLNTRYLGVQIGKASGLKACFAALSKGFTALALQSYTTATRLAVLPDLRFYLDAYNPAARERAEKGIVGCTGKAYRWVEEMQQIGQTFAVQGGFGEQARVFREIADVYQGLADLVEQQGSEGLGEAEGVVERFGDFLREGEGSGRVEGEEK